MKRAQRLDHFRDGLESSEKEQRTRFMAAEGRATEARTASPGAGDGETRPAVADTAPSGQLALFDPGG